METHNDCPFHADDENSIQALEKLKLAVKIAFANVMQAGGLSPIAALNLTAMAVGLLYVEVAAAHTGANHCSCGWRPRGVPDVEAMKSSLAFSVVNSPSTLESTMHVGHA